jgi:arginyl-tRNA synthetase
MKGPAGERIGGAVADPWAEFLDRIVPALVAALGEEGVGLDAEAARSQLAWIDGDRGDMALALHRLAKERGRDATDLAAGVARRLSGLAEIARVQPTGPFLNFAADDLWLTRTTLASVAQRGARWGSLDGGESVVCVEHTSANPTGPFHVGRVRNGIIGDTLARVLRASGASVTTQYYVDDVGRQAAMITWIWSQPYPSWPEEIRAAVPPETVEDATLRPDVRWGRPYPAVSRFLKTHPEAAAEVQALGHRLERGDEIPRHHELASAILGGMMDSLARIGITFDEFVWESSFLRNGDVERVVGRLAHAPHAVREENGALAIDTESYGLPKDTARVIVTRADGSTLYAVRDIAYHLAKFARFPRAIDVLGQDHHLHSKTLAAMLAEIGEPRSPEFVIYQDITVPEGGRMSTRQGKVVYLDDLLDEAIERARAEVRSRHTDLTEPEVEGIARSVAAAAVRYHIVRVAPEKTVQFRWEDALSFEGRSGPFLQYSFARASSILRKAGPRDSADVAPEHLLSPPERALTKQISRLPPTVGYVARTTHVHALAGYAHDLAEQFNRFYETTPVLTAERERASRLALVEAARQTLGTALALLGVDALERM